MVILVNRDDITPQLCCTWLGRSSESGNLKSEAQSKPGLAITCKCSHADPQGCVSKEKWSAALQLHGHFSHEEVGMDRGTVSGS